VAGFVDAIIVFFDTHLDQEDIRRFLVKEYQMITEGDSFPEDVRIDLSSIEMILENLGWIILEDRLPVKEVEFISHVDAAELWKEKLYGDHVVSRNVVKVGAGENLDILDSYSRQAEFVRSEAERLLRHVEYHRRRSMTLFSEILTEIDSFKEKADMAVFFSRYALRHLDLRFLNAAFKLNEGLMRIYRRPQDLDSRLKFLLALGEQEKSARELLK